MWTIGNTEQWLTGTISEGKVGLGPVDVIPQKHVTQFLATTESPTQSWHFPKFGHIYIFC